MYGSTYYNDYEYYKLYITIINKPSFQDIRKITTLPNYSIIKNLFNNINKGKIINSSDSSDSSDSDSSDSSDSDSYNNSGDNDTNDSKFINTLL